MVSAGNSEVEDTAPFGAGAGASLLGSSTVMMQRSSESGMEGTMHDVESGRYS